MARFKVVSYMRVDAEEPEWFDNYNDVCKEAENLELLEGLEPMNMYLIEEEDDEGSKTD